MHVKVLIAQTGSIDYVPREYYERYKDEGIILIPEDVPKVELGEPKEELKVELEEPKVELEEPKEEPKVELEEPKEEPKVELEEPKEEPKVELEEPKAPILKKTRGRQKKQ